jgi:hypothetical protein
MQPSNGQKWAQTTIWRCPSCGSRQQKPPLSGAFRERMMGLEPTTFCMATRPGVLPAAASFRLMQGVEPKSRSPGCRRRHETAPHGSQTLASRLQCKRVLQLPHRNPDRRRFYKAVS